MRAIPQALSAAICLQPQKFNHRRRKVCLHSNSPASSDMEGGGGRLTFNDLEDGSRVIDNSSGTEEEEEKEEKEGVEKDEAGEEEEVDEEEEEEKEGAEKDEAGGEQHVNEDEEDKEWVEKRKGELEEEEHITTHSSLISRFLQNGGRGVFARAGRKKILILDLWSLTWRHENLVSSPREHSMSDSTRRGIGMRHTPPWKPFVTAPG